MFTSLYSITTLFMMGDGVKTVLDPEILIFLLPSKQNNSNHQ